MAPAEAQIATEPAPTTVVEATEVRANHALRLGAAFASSMLPGAGQWALKRGVIAFFFHLAFAALAFAYWYGQAAATYKGLVAVLVAGWVLFSLSTWEALRSHSDCAQRGSTIWLAVFIPIAVMVSTAFANIALQASGCRTYGIPSESMEHTLNIGDRLIVDTTYFRNHIVRTGDIVIFHKGEQQYCKRVIATAGSQVEGINDVIYVGGERLQEPYVRHTGGVPDDMSNFGPVVVPPGSLFVMGDNRDHSLDSRAPEFGFIPEANLIGKPLYLYYSESVERNGRKLE